MSREIMQQALDALKNGKQVRAGEGGTKYQPDLEDAVIAALEAELAKPEQKPKLTDAGSDTNIDPFTLHPKGSGMVTLNQVGMRVDFNDATPRKPWQGLTNDEVKSSISNLLEDDPNPLLTLADVIQERLREKNGG